MRVAIYQDCGKFWTKNPSAYQGMIHVSLPSRRHSHHKDLLAYEKCRFDEIDSWEAIHERTKKSSAWIDLESL